MRGVRVSLTPPSPHLRLISTHEPAVRWGMAHGLVMGVGRGVSGRLTAHPQPLPCLQRTKGYAGMAKGGVGGSFTLHPAVDLERM